jgi:hypothetical protein
MDLSRSPITTLMVGEGSQIANHRQRDGIGVVFAQLPLSFTLLNFGRAKLTVERCIQHRFLFAARTDLFP